jgi:hypothetical protein
MGTEPGEEVTGRGPPGLSLGDQETVTRVSPMRTQAGAPIKVEVDRHSQRQSYGAGYIQAIPRGSPEPLLNPCRLHKTRKHKVTVAGSDWALRDARPSISHRIFLLRRHWHFAKSSLRPIRSGGNPPCQQTSDAQTAGQRCIIFEIRMSLPVVLRSGKKPWCLGMDRPCACRQAGYRQVIGCQAHHTCTETLAAGSPSP